jgi:hypothetical protein
MSDAAMSDAAARDAAARYTLTVLPLRLAVCALPADAAVPAWATAGAFFSVTRTPDELSVICPEEDAPAGPSVDVGWACLRVEGPFAFTVTGVLAALTAALAAAEAPCLALATYQTDYLLVKQSRLAAAVDALRAADHIVRTAQA